MLWACTSLWESNTYIYLVRTSESWGQHQCRIKFKSIHIINWCYIINRKDIILEFHLMIYIIKIVFMMHIRYLYLYGLTLIFKWLEPINSQFKKRTNQFIIKSNGFELETYKLNSFLVTIIAYINDYTMLYAFKNMK